MFKIGDVVKMKSVGSNQPFYTTDFLIITGFSERTKEICFVDKIIKVDNLINIQWLQHLDECDNIKLRLYKINKLKEKINGK